MAGMFISFEGGEGAGKSTQIAVVKEYFLKRKQQVLLTIEPGGTELGKVIRQALLHGENMSPRAEALLYAADRAHHVETLVRPAIANGMVVLTDRYLDSSVAYQGAARNLGTQEVRTLSIWATKELLPDLTFLIDLDPQLGFSRRAGTSLDRLESESIDFHQKVRTKFLEIAAAEPHRIKVIDASRSLTEVSAAIIDHIETYLNANENVFTQLKPASEHNLNPEPENLLVKKLLEENREN